MPKATVLSPSGTVTVTLPPTGLPAASMTPNSRSPAPLAKTFTETSTRSSWASKIIQRVLLSWNWPASVAVSPPTADTGSVPAKSSTQYVVVSVSTGVTKGLPSKIGVSASTASYQRRFDPVALSSTGPEPLTSTSVAAGAAGLGYTVKVKSSEFPVLPQMSTIETVYVPDSVTVMDCVVASFDQSHAAPLGAISSAEDPEQNSSSPINVTCGMPGSTTTTSTAAVTPAHPSAVKTVAL